MQDSFNRANTSGGLGTPDVGPTWVNYNGVADVISNQAGFTTVSGDSYAGADVAQADVNVSYIRPTGGSSAGMFLRRSDNSNNLVLIDDAGLTYYKKVAGSYTQIGSSANVLNSTSTLEMDLSGSSHTCLMDGVSQFTATDSFNSTATIHGLFNNGTTAQRWDNWLVTGASSGTTITPGAGAVVTATSTPSLALSIPAGAGAVSTSTSTPSIGLSIPAGAGSALFSPSTPSLGLSIPAGAGAAVFNTYAPTVQIGGYTFTPNPGTLSFNGNAPGLGLSIPAGLGAAVFATYAPTITVAPVSTFFAASVSARGDTITITGRGDGVTMSGGVG